MQRDTLRLPATAASLAAAIDFVRDAAGAAGIGDTQRLKVELVVEELFMNTATHGQEQDCAAAAAAAAISLCL